MLLPFSVREAASPPVWERAVHSVNCTCLSWALVKFCVYLLSLLVMRVGYGIQLY